jgi:hypothetical protein
MQWEPRRATFPSTWPSSARKDVLVTRKDANRVFYRVGDQRTLQLVSMMREVFCGDGGVSDADGIHQPECPAHRVGCRQRSVAALAGICPSLWQYGVNPGEATTAD